MRTLSAGIKPDFLSVRVRAYNTTILAGAPCHYLFEGTSRDGYLVCNTTEIQALQSGSDANAYRKTFAGIAHEDIAPGNTGEVLVYGFCTQMRIVRSTRAATTDAFPDAGAIDILAGGFQIFTAGNVFTVAADAFAHHNIVMAQTFAFMAGTDMPSTALLYTTFARTFLNWRVL